jgi:hypothetical protein
VRRQLEAFRGKTVFVFTTFGHTYVGAVADIEDDVVQLIAADGSSQIVLNLADVSGVRLYVEELEDRP